MKAKYGSRIAAIRKAAQDRVAKYQAHYKRLAAEAAKQAEPPCDTCCNAGLCGRVDFACTAFERYMDGKPWLGTCRKPSREIFVRVMAS